MFWVVWNYLGSKDSCLAFDLARVLLGISLITLDLMRVGLGKTK